MEDSTPKNYLVLINQLNKRFRFVYKNTEALKDYFWFCCNKRRKNKRLREELFDHGQSKIEKNLDIVNMIRNMRE